MSRLERQPNEPAIFLQSFELSKMVIQSTNNFPKPARYVLGNKLEQKILDFVLLLNRLVGPSGIRFLKADRRRLVLEELSMLLDEFRILLRVAREVGVYSAGHYQTLSELTHSIGRQIGGMLRQTSKGSHDVSDG